MSKLFDFLKAKGFQRGVVGSSTGWFAVWAGVAAARQLHKRLGRQPVLVERIVLKPGQTVEIRDTGVPWKDDAKVPRR